MYVCVHFNVQFIPKAKQKENSSRQDDDDALIASWQKQAVQTNFRKRKLFDGSRYLEQCLRSPSSGSISVMQKQPSHNSGLQQRGTWALQLGQANSVTAFKAVTSPCFRIE